jgi:hypothetical protein
MFWPNWPSSSAQVLHSGSYKVTATAMGAQKHGTRTTIPDTSKTQNNWIRLVYKQHSATL